MNVNVGEDDGGYFLENRRDLDLAFPLGEFAFVFLHWLRGEGREERFGKIWGFCSIWAIDWIKADWSKVNKKIILRNNRFVRRIS